MTRPRSGRGHDSTGFPQNGFLWFHLLHIVTRFHTRSVAMYKSVLLAATAATASAFTAPTLPAAGIRTRKLPFPF